MDQELFQKWQTDGLISETSLQRVKAADNNRLFSLNWELRTILYTGVVLLAGGLSILVYLHIDSIGHTAVLSFIALLSIACYAYCFRTKKAFTRQQDLAPNPYFDYILLLGCLAMVSFIGYIQYQYAVFGHGYRLATFIPMVLLFISAYFFDHLGVLSLAITNLAAWMGLTVTPSGIFSSDQFAEVRLIYTAIGLGVILLLAAWVSNQRSFKKHFEFTYANFGTHILFIAGLAGLFTRDNEYFGWFVFLAVVTILLYRQALSKHSFYFVTVVILYAYIAVSDIIARWIDDIVRTHGYPMWPYYVLCIYFILSAIGVTRILISLNRKINTHDRL